MPFVARGVEKAADLNSFNLGLAAGRDMAVSFVVVRQHLQGVARAVRYGIMFIGIVFLATLIFEAVSGRKAHPAQYILVGLAQCVFYLLLLSMTEIIGFTVVVRHRRGGDGRRCSPTTPAPRSSRRRWACARLVGPGRCSTRAMYVLMTLEDFALFAGSVVAFAVIAATMIATRRIDWYGRGVPETRHRDDVTLGQFARLTGAAALVRFARAMVELTLPKNSKVKPGKRHTRAARAPSGSASSRSTATIPRPARTRAGTSTTSISTAAGRWFSTR